MCCRRRCCRHRRRRCHHTLHMPPCNFSQLCRHHASSSPPPLPPPGMLELRPGQHMGCLGLQFSSRRRVRVNGVLEAAERDPADGSLSRRLRVQQAYTTCPQYIQASSGAI